MPLRGMKGCPRGRPQAHTERIPDGQRESDADDGLARGAAMAQEPQTDAYGAPAASSADQSMSERFEDDDEDLLEDELTPEQSRRAAADDRVLAAVSQAAAVRMIALIDAVVFVVALLPRLGLPWVPDGLDVVVALSFFGAFALLVSAVMLIHQAILVLRLRPVPDRGGPASLIAAGLLSGAVLIGPVMENAMEPRIGAVPLSVSIAVLLGILVLVAGLALAGERRLQRVLEAAPDHVRRDGAAS